MEDLLHFIIRSSVILLTGYLIYRFVFRKEGYFLFNRFFLLSTLVLSVVMPLLPIHVGMWQGVSPTVQTVQYPLEAISRILLNEVTISASGTDVGMAPKADLSFWLLVIYAIGLLLGFIRLIFRLVQLLIMVRNSEKIPASVGTYVRGNSHGDVFSFFGYIFLTPAVLDNPILHRQIIAHEQQHVIQKHSFDMLLAELMTIVFWFNPLVFLLKKEIRENHELLADDAVLTQYPDTQNYQLLLVTHSTQLNSQLLTHNFSYSLLKRRLFMMKNVKHPVRMLFKSIWIFIAVAIMAVACSDATQTPYASLPDNVEKIDIPEAKMLPEDSVHLIFGFNMNVRKADFLAQLGKEQPCRLDIFDNNNKLIVTLFDTRMGSGYYKTTWDIAPDIDYFSYVFTAGENRITGNSYIDPEKSYNKETDVYRVVEKMPEYPGGISQLMKYLADNINYPAEAKEKGVQGRVFVNFIVEADGSVSNVNVLRGIGAGCDEEAVRVVSSMPKWTPGEQDGQPVRVSFNIPVKYTLN